MREKTYLQMHQQLWNHEDVKKKKFLCFFDEFTIHDYGYLYNESYD